MAYKLLFQKEKSFFVITIQDRKITYWDKLQGPLWKGALQYLPRDDDMMNKLVRKIKSSRNRIPAYMIDLFDVPKEELEEYENAKTDEELKEIVLKDCKRNNCKLIKEEKI
jgi:hypothetical protein